MTRQKDSSLSLQPSSLLPELKKLVTSLSEDLLVRSTENAEVDAGLREAYAQIEKGGRTADPFEVWRDDYLDQVAVAWVLGCIFVRFMEDNYLIDECWLAGEGERRKLAEDMHELYFRDHPHESDREYFEHVFHEVGKIPACRDLFAEGKTPLWAVGPSGDAAMKLLAFWRDIHPEGGQLMRSFNVRDGDTRFLGDLYQNLSERARKKYALLQTPVFVEEFILDRTLDPAIDEFGLNHELDENKKPTNDSFKMIDPTCGSGHFLLGGFARLFKLWIKREDNEIAAAQKALDGVWGVDINPFAVAIARFRLIVAALQVCGMVRLRSAHAWRIHLATGDSLLFGKRWNKDERGNAEEVFFETEGDASWAPEIYACEDKDAVSETLGQQYHVVVGNPPYITVKDKVLNQAYRDRYSTCHRKFALTVPFMERFFDLAVAQTDGKSGYVGQITANSFMKREFGKKLIEEFIPRIDLTHVIDTSGMRLAGHGTPTVILLGRNRKPMAGKVRAVLGITGDPPSVGDAADGNVWKSILSHIDMPGSQDGYTSASDVPRSSFTAHPWSIGGGGASTLQRCLESSSKTALGEKLALAGVFGMTNADDVFLADLGSFRRKHVEQHVIRPLLLGDEIRDWQALATSCAAFPYGADERLVEIESCPQLLKWLWPSKTILGNRATFGKGTYFSEGLPWWKWHQVALDRIRTPLSITFAFVATHNHFVFDRGGRVFKQSSPILKLDAEAAECEHIALLGVLNSSTGCFWMKQAFHDKGGGGIGGGIAQESWEHFYEFTGTGLQRFPLPLSIPVELPEKLDQAVREYTAVVPDAIVASQVPSSSSLQIARQRGVALRDKMIALQEELDWQCYELYGIAHEDLCYRGELPEIQLGQRAFEIVMARRMASGEFETTWFERHGSRPIIEVPTQWPADYRKLVDRRMELIETDQGIGLIERPEYKRRWNTESWKDQEQRALRNWLLGRLESQRYWPDPQQHEPCLQSVAELSDKASGDHEFLQVAAIYRGREGFDAAALVAELILSESVPFLPVLRYKSGGLRKREVWEKTWEFQRKKDVGEDIGEIKVPPKYTTGDFQRSDFWRLRGKLDVPKERWISYPHCETESDPSLVVGWAGWSHLQQATALVAYYDARKREGWDAKRLTPLMAGLDQLLPWIHQWHPEVDPEFGETAGQSFETMLKADAHELGLTLEEIRAWEPPAKKKGGRRKAKA